MEKIPDNVEGMDADLMRLKAEVAAVDGASPELVAGQQQEAAQAAQQVDMTAQEVQELKTLLQIVSGLFVPLIPKLAEIYTPEACEMLAAAAVPVMQKRGWSTGGMLGQWGAELALLAVSAPMAIATYQAVKEAQEEAKAKAKEAEKKPVSQVNLIPEPDGEGVEGGAMSLQRG